MGGFVPGSSIPTYPRCRRCDIAVGEGNESGRCDDCRTSATSEREITLHYPTQPQLCPTMRALKDLKVKFQVATNHTDSTAVNYMNEVLGTQGWPAVLITDYGQYVDHWDGFQPERLAALAPKQAKELQAA